MDSDRVARFLPPETRETVDAIVSRLAQAHTGYSLSSEEIQLLKDRIWQVWTAVGDYAGNIPARTPAWPDWATREQRLELDAHLRAASLHVLWAFRAAMIRERIEREVELLRGV